MLIENLTEGMIVRYRRTNLLRVAEIFDTYCTAVVLLDHGRVVRSGPVRAYREKEIALFHKAMPKTIREYEEKL